MTSPHHKNLMPGAGPGRTKNAIPLVYLAGPYRAKWQSGVEENIRRAKSEAQFIASFGGYPVTPHLNTGLFDFTMPKPPEDAFWIEATQILLRKCDMLYMIPEWERSEGAKEERTIAIEKGLPVYYTLQDVREAIKDWRRG